MPGPPIQQLRLIVVAPTFPLPLEVEIQYNREKVHEGYDMAQDATKDFFISYNKADRPWAEWMAWQLEAEGYTTVLQAWDFLPGSNGLPLSCRILPDKRAPCSLCGYANAH